MKALNNYIVVRPIVEEQKKMAGGLLLTGTESVKQRYQKAEVVVMCEEIPAIKEGDIIAYDAVQGHDYRLNEEVLRIIQYRDVALIL